MSDTVPQQFDNVSIICKANTYFDGKVISYTILFSDGKKKTIGIIFSGSFSFNTNAPERMEIISGNCRVRQAGDEQWSSYSAGTYFVVSGNSSFEIAVDEGMLEYVCSYE